MGYDEKSAKGFSFDYRLKKEISHFTQYDDIEMDVLSNIKMDWYPLCGT